MPERQYRTLTKRIVDRLAVNGKDGVFWGSELPGFGIRVYPTGRKVYVVHARAKGKSRRVTVGRHGGVAPDQARKDAAKIIARLKAGLPPLEQAPEPEPTVADLAERYERECVAMHCKPSTVKRYGLVLKKRIVPGLGGLRVSEVEKKHILKFQFGLSDMPTVANRTVDILVKMLNMAELWEMRPPGRNPCRSVRRYKVEPHKERFLTPKELARLGRTLDIAPEKCLAARLAAAAVRLLALTGGAGATGSWGLPGTTSTSRRARCGSPTARRVRASSRCHLQRWRRSRNCHAFPAIRGGSLAGRRAPIRPNCSKREAVAIRGRASCGARGTSTAANGKRSQSAARDQTHRIQSERRLRVAGTIIPRGGTRRPSAHDASWAFVRARPRLHFPGVALR